MLAKWMTVIGIVVAAALARPAGLWAGGSDQQGARSVVGRSDGSDLAELVRGYSADRAALDRFYNLPWSEVRYDRLEQLYRTELERLGRVDFDTLNSQGRIDYILLRNHLGHGLARLARERRKLAEMDELLPFREAALELECARRRMEPLDPEASAAKLAAFPEQVKQIRKRIEQGTPTPAEREASPPASAEAQTTGSAKPDTGAVAETPTSAEPSLKVPAVIARRAAAAVGALRGMLEGWYSFYDGYQPDFSWWVRQPYEEAERTLDEYAQHLRESVAGIKGADDDPLIGVPVGADALADDLLLEMLPYSPEELIAIGEREFAWCAAEMAKASALMGMSGGWKAALAKVKAEHVPPGEQDDLVTAQAREVIRFLEDRELLTIPPLCTETWRVTMISPATQKVLPFAAYGGQNIMVAYATETMKHADKLMSMRGNNRHFSRIVTAHELIPGHHLQAFVNRRHRPYRALFTTPFFFEGWALYWEMTLWDLGYARTPEERIGMLFWRMHRAARIIVSLKFHLGQMTPDEMVDFLVQRVGHEHLGARSEVRRYIGEGYSPLYQCSYMIGGLQLRALRRELVDSGRMEEREFHDRLLTYGAIPVELIRADMLNLPLTSTRRASWEFAGPASGK